MKFLHVIKSPSFNTDGRLQKWLSQLRKTKHQSTVFIVEDTNQAYQRPIHEDSIVSVPLFFRKYFKQRKGYAFKVPEYFIKTIKFAKKEKFDVVIFHDVQQYLNVFYFLLKYKKRHFKIVWDLHELPHEFLLKNSWTKQILKFLLNHVDMVVYTNKERRQYIVSKIQGVREKKTYILNNFPDQTFILSPKSIAQFNTFKNENPYFLWLGAAVDGRNFGTFLEAYKSFSDKFNLVILGKVQSVYKSDLNALKDEGKVFIDFVNQSEILKYIDNSYLSVVLYNSNSANNYLCEPNRLYQLVSRNVPIIVGNNPVMASLVNQYELGYVMEDDGRNKVELIKGINHVIKNHDQLVIQSKKVDFSKILSWENQINYIINDLSDNK